MLRRYYHGIWQLNNGKVCHVITVDIHQKGVRKNIDFTQLPTQLTGLYLSGNHFYDDVDLTQLPESLERLELFSNSFSGIVDLNNLPQNLKELRLNDNLFTGIKLNPTTSLPSKLEYLALYGNNFPQSFECPEVRSPTVIDC